MTVSKIASGIRGFDVLSEGGLPAGQATLVLGTPGTGKTVFCLHTLSNYIRRGAGAAVLVTFEEGPDQLLANAAGFDWNPTDLRDNGLILLDGRVSTRGTQAGDFQLDGMIAMLDGLVRNHGVGLVAFDGIDQILELLPDPVRRRQELMRLVDWMAGQGVTALVTGKGSAEQALSQAPYSFMIYAIGCVVQLSRETANNLMIRTVEVLKYRGSSFRGGRYPFLIDTKGFEIAAGTDVPDPPEVPEERISTGVARLDELLSGGLQRGSAALYSGAPGTSKTTLGAAFAHAVAARGETAVYVALDESFEQIVRNTRSLGIDLMADSLPGRVVPVNLLGREGSPAEQYVRIDQALAEYRPEALVVDPVSALGKGFEDEAARAFAERLMRTAKLRRITCVATSLTSQSRTIEEETRSGVSTIADTWITLSYHAARGERNRALSIVKSRGTRHSSQVRELILGGENGIDLADVYFAGTEVLMGTARLAYEDQLAAEEEEARERFETQRRSLEAQAAAAQARTEQMRAELDRVNADLEAARRDEERRQERRLQRRSRIEESRQGSVESSGDGL